MNLNRPNRLLFRIIAVLLMSSCFVRANSFLPDGSIGRIGYGTIRKVSYSGNGKLLAVATTIGLRLINTETQRQIGFYRQDGYISDIAFISDQLVAIATDSGVKFVDLLDPRQNIPTPTLIQGGIIDSVAVSVDSNWLVVGLTENRADEKLAASVIYIYTIEGKKSGNDQPTFAQAQVLSLEGTVKDIQFDPAPSGYDQMLAVATTRELHLWRKGVNESVYRSIQKGIYAKGAEIQKIAYNHDGKLLFVGTYDAKNDTSDIYIQETKNPQPQFWQQLGAEKLYDLTFHSSQKNLLAYATDKTLRIWELYASDASPKPPQILKRDFVADGISLAFHPYQADLIVGADNNPFEDALIYLQIGKAEVPVRTVLNLRDFHSQVVGVSFPNQPNGKLAVAYQSRRVVIWNQEELTPIITLPAPNQIIGLDYGPSGLDLAISTKTNQVEVNDLSADPPKNINEQFGNTHPEQTTVNAVRFSDQNDWVASVANDGSLRIRRKGATSFDKDDIFVGVSVQDVDFNYDGTLMAVVTENGRIAVFSVSSKDGVQEISVVPTGGALTKIAFSPVKRDNRFIVGLENGAVQTWEILAGGKVGRTGQLNVDRNISQGRVNAVSVSADGRFFAAAIGDAVWVWNYASIQKGPKLFRGHTDTVTGLTFTTLTDGTNILASGSRDGTVLLWNIQREVAGVLQQGEIWRLVAPNQLENVAVTSKIRIRMPTFSKLREETVTPFSIQVHGQLADQSIKPYSSHQSQFKIEGPNLVLFDPQAIFREEEEITVRVSSVIEDHAGKYLQAGDIVFRTGLVVWPGDTNRDGKVDVVDVLPLGQFWNDAGPIRDKGDNTWRLQPAVAWKEKLATHADANGDGVINQDDIIPISENWRKSRQIEKNAAAPTHTELDRLADISSIPTPYFQIYNQLYQRLKDVGGNTELMFVLERIIERLKSDVIPTISKLLPNYPNPFNPETWIPYQLANDATVKVKIYDLQGRVIRTLDLGYQRAGYYTDQSRALHWDGKNENGEAASSGVYFYHLVAKTERSAQNTEGVDFSDQHRFVILK